uniref:UDP-glucuronosyltransferase n=1 Tax=Sinocyclocheilus grahami TaxID=75366 RepID=A0A672SXN2_SINGR
MALTVPALGLLALLRLFSSGSVPAGKVLVMPVDGSYWLSMKILVEEHSHRGHEMVVLVPETSVLIGKSANYTTKYFRVPNTHKNAFEKPPKLTDIVENLGNLIQFLNMHVTACEGLLYDKTLMKSFRETGFDVLLTDPFLPCGTIIADSFSLPAIYFLHMIPCLLDVEATQCPSPLSFVPRFFIGYTDKMTFPQRIESTLMAVFDVFLCRKLFARTDELASRYLQKDTTYKEQLSHGAVWLLRYEFTFEYPKPQMPNMVQIGGINCAKKGPLTKELEEFVNGSGEHGFVVFTLGSMVSQLPEAKARELFEAFRQIPQRVLWRHTGPVPENAPKNVKLMKWLPQNDLLGHPKVKAFITHGGSHGIYEGICNGVPMVMLPLFGDQGDNVQRLVSRGVAEALSIHDLTAEKLLVALRKVINDKSYKEKITELSAIHRDRPIEPLDLAVFWTEFVMRHKGAAHLRPAAHELNWIQYHSLDVIGFLLLILVTVIFVTVKSCMFCFRKCFKKTQKKKKE